MFISILDHVLSINESLIGTTEVDKYPQNGHISLVDISDELPVLYKNGLFICSYIVRKERNHLQIFKFINKFLYINLKTT